MKVLKIIIGIIVVLVVLLVAYFMTLDSAYKVERSAKINAPASLVMEHIANFKEWEAWSPWKAKDPEAKYTFSGPESGVGASMSWVTSLPDDSAGSANYIGEGGMEISELNGSESVKYTLTFKKPWESSSTGGFELSEDNGVTTVRWYDTGELPFIMRPMGAMMDGMIGPDFEKGLAFLKTHVEEHAAMAPKSDYVIEEITVESFPYLAITDSITVDQISSTLGAMYGKIQEYLKSQQIEMAGAPFAIYHTWDYKTTKMTGGIPVAEEVKGSDEIQSGMSYAGPALKVVHMGSYEGTGNAHEAIDVYMQANGKEMVGAPWEVYVTDPMTEMDTSKWVTEIYYPVK